jgi:hypothetical protein
MPIDISAWLGDTTAISETERAALAYRRILDKPTSVVFKTAAGVTLAAQTVRVESDSIARPAMSAAGLAPVRRVVVFGIKGHATLADTNMAEGYRFVLGNDELRIVDIILTLGEIQGLAEATG